MKIIKKCRLVLFLEKLGQADDMETGIQKMGSLISLYIANVFPSPN